MSLNAGGAQPDEAEIATDLVRRIAAGDIAAETALVQRYSRGLLYLLRRLGASPELADDLHQETFRIVLERLRRKALDEPAGLAGFLRGTARNLLIAERRKATRRRTDADPDGLERTVSPTPGQLASVLLDEEATIVRRLIEELPTDRDRQLLLRFYVAEEEKESICADLGLDHLHFNRVLFRARNRFKELLVRFQARQGPAARM
ncbi:MAG TPA: sigma-70 family RNA polymerase sigma factor [Thermoanaerobaculia bacterium]|jgi:RNA polymerase sigma-70 factor (ECF subfamily)|nr:sigma-70 family RNA polymerase sigma factor [Thermoanaerobaculia bacterium]